ncbi:MAG: hypothetical protein U0R51_03035 [Solirubrobacterales bacterium]
MEREEIVRDDFPTARKGWRPDAVTAHLRAVADWAAASSMRAKEKATPTADVASERVASVLAAAESTAAEIVEEAESEAERIVIAAEAEADQIRAAARTESNDTVNAARSEASGRIDQAQAAVEGLVAQADRLRAQVAALGRDLASSVTGLGSAEPPEAVAEEPDPEPDPDPEEGDARTDPVAATEIDDAEAGPDPERERPAAAAGRPTDDELIARLRASADAPVAEEPPAPAVSGSEQGAVRLVAMNMALDGASREQIAKQIEAEFGSVAGVDQLLDEVLKRANR